MQIKAAGSADIPAILDIWNPIIRDTTITFTNVEKTTRDIEEILAERKANKQPFLIASKGTQLYGFATYGSFRKSPGYAFTMEHSIMLAKAGRNQGFGRALMLALERIAVHNKIHSLIASVSSDNAPAIGFHLEIGFTEVAYLPEVGFKFGQWHDSILLQKRLQNH